MELCDRALTMIREAGGDRDPFARRRLPAGVQSALTTQTLGFVPGVAQDAAETLLQKHDEIDAEELRGRGSA